MTEQPTNEGISVRTVVIAAIVVTAFGALLIGGFVAGRGEAAAEARSEEAIKPAVEVSHRTGSLPTITLTPDLREHAAIQTVQPQTILHQQQIQAFGIVLDLQPITDADNAVAAAQAQLSTARARLAASRPALERARILHQKDQNFSTAQLQAAEANYQSDFASFQAAQVQSRNAIANAYQNWGPVLGKSLAEGTALAKDLVQHRKVLIQITLPMGVSIAQAPQTASVETTTGQRVNIDFVSRATRTDPQIQGVSFFYVADAASAALSGMNVAALLPVGKAVPGVYIPASAVVWSQGRAWVYLQTGANEFSRREIPTDEPQDGGYVVPALAPAPQPASGASTPNAGGESYSINQPLVVQGAQTLLSQEFSAQIQIGGD